MVKITMPFVLLFVCLMFSSGCATITRGTKEVLVVESDPSGADVELSTGLRGKTPTSFKLKRKRDLVVTISKAGYETATINVNSQIAGAGAAGMAGNLVFGGLIGAGIDAGSGATKQLKPNPVTVKLNPITSGSGSNKDQKPKPEQVKDVPKPTT